MVAPQPGCPRCGADDALVKHCKSFWCRWEWCRKCHYIIGDRLAQRWIPGPGGGS